MQDSGGGRVPSRPERTKNCTQAWHKETARTRAKSGSQVRYLQSLKNFPESQQAAATAADEVRITAQAGLLA